MRKKFFGHILGLALSVSLVLSGCGSSSSGPPPGGGSGTSGTSSTSTTSTTGGTTGIATTAGTGGGFTGGGSSSSSTSTTTSTTTTTTTGGAGFAGDVDDRILYPASTGTDPSQQVTNPTQYARIGTRIFFLEGFDTGAGNGRLLSFDLNDALNSPVGQPTFQRLRQPGNPTERLDEFFNPFGVIAGPGNTLYVSTGFNIPSAGAIIRISNINASGTEATFTRITTSAEFLINPTFMALANVDGAQHIYWSEYAAIGSSGRVRRARADGVGVAQTVVTGLNFPAGLAHDGLNLMICENDGPPLGRVLRTPLSMAADEAPRAPGQPSVVAIEGNTANPFSRPFNVVYDGANGFFIAEGNTINIPGGSFPTPLGPGNGAVRYVPSNGTTAQLVSSGLNQVAGIDAAVLPNGEVGLVFTESTALVGRVLRHVVDVDNIADRQPEQIDSGLFYPLTVGIESIDGPLFLGITGYVAGQGNGLVKAYLP